MEASGRAFFSYVSFSRWLGVYVDFISLLFIFGCLLAAYLRPTSSSSQSALALSSVLQLLNNFEYAIRLSVEACSSLASVERMQEYTQLP